MIPTDAQIHAGEAGAEGPPRLRLNKVSHAMRPIALFNGQSPAFARPAPYVRWQRVEAERQALRGLATHIDVELLASLKRRDTRQNYLNALQAQFDS